MQLLSLLLPGNTTLATPAVLASGHLFPKTSCNWAGFSSVRFKGGMLWVQAAPWGIKCLHFQIAPEQGLTHLSSHLQIQHLLCNRPSTSLSSCLPFPQIRHTVSISAGSNTANCCRRSLASLQRMWPNGVWKRWVLLPPTHPPIGMHFFYWVLSLGSLPPFSFFFSFSYRLFWPGVVAQPDVYTKTWDRWICTDLSFAAISYLTSCPIFGPLLTVAFLCFSRLLTHFTLQLSCACLHSGVTKRPHSVAGLLTERVILLGLWFYSQSSCCALLQARVFLPCSQRLSDTAFSVLHTVHEPLDE